MLSDHLFYFKGGVAGLLLCLFAKLQKRLDKKLKEKQDNKLKRQAASLDINRRLFMLE